VSTPASRVLVTGGAGFIGSELVRQLVDAGHAVVVVDNLVNGRRENLADLPTDRVELLVEDIRDPNRFANVLRETSIVFNLACLGVRHSVHSPVENHEVNASATLELLAAARSAGVKRFIHVSSSEVYGTGRWVPMTEEHPTYPHTVYGASKLAGECYARAYHATYGYATTIIRPFNAYGPRCHHEGDSGEVIPKFVLRCLAGKPMIVFGDGTQTRDFTYVGDTAGAILASGFSDATIGQTINVGSGAEVTMNELARQVSAVVGRGEAEVIHDAPRPGDVLRLYAGADRAAALLGFKPRVRLSEGLARLRDWYEASGQSAEQLLEQERVRNWEPVGSPS
jgi:UDP-glucose 4-epimerase